MANVYRYEAADGVTEDDIKAFEWAEKAALQGHTQALLLAVFGTDQSYLDNQTHVTYYSVMFR